MYIGIDLGTSAVKVLLVDERQQQVAQASAALEVRRPRPTWSEQDPEDWWRAVQDCFAQLYRRDAGALGKVRAIGLAGQMHGAVLLDGRDRVLRPAILWNDGRSAEQCATLEQREPRSRQITGNLAMAGFTAPKLLWVAAHEPEIFRAVKKVLLPKDYLRLRLSGEFASEMSDAAGTLWLDVAQRAWSAAMLAATELPESSMPALFEGSEATGKLLPALAEAWGMDGDVIVAGGGGDNAAGAIGVGVIRPGQAFLSLGTSGVYFVATERFKPNPERAVHTFCHCLPDTWHQMSVILSAASALTWFTHASGAASEAELLAEIEQRDSDSQVIFLPYLSGERTPHNDANARGVFVGMTHETTRADLGRAVLEGVAFAFVDGQDALLEAGTRIDNVSVIGGGARSELWGRILASALDRPLQYHRVGEVGPAFGAARLARLARTGEDAETVCDAPPVEQIIEPAAKLRESCRSRLGRYRRLYAALKDEYRDG